MYRVGQFKEIYTKTPLIAHQRVGGEFRLILRNPDDSVARDTGWFHNLITNTGLVNFNGTVSVWYNNIHIGSSNTAPAFTDTALGSWLATQSSSLGNTEGPTAAGPNYQFYTTRGARFNAGVGTGTVRELGLNHNSSNAAMCIRVLVSPEVVKAVNQVLDVYYRFTVYPELGDSIGVVSIAGEDYNYILRPQMLTELHTAFATFSPNGNPSTHIAYSGAIGTNITKPASVITNPWAESVTLVTRGSGFYEYLLKWSLDYANHVNGIRCIGSRNDFNRISSERGWQVQFTRVSDSAAVPKNNTKEFFVTIRMTWARH